MSGIDVLNLSVAARQALFLRSAPRAGNHQTTATSVSGSTVRGALAALWLADHDQPDDVFRELFEGGVAWPALRPVGHVVVPMSVRRCKYRPQPGCEATAHDTFMSPSRQPDQPEPTCTVCGGPLELSKGDLVATIREAVPETVTRTSVQLEDSETAKDGQLFSRDALAAGTRLDGAAPLPRPLSHPARRWIEGLEGRTLRVGGRRSVAGAVRVEHVAWSSLATPAATPTGTQVALRLVTPAVVLDAFGATTTQPQHLLRGTVLEHHLKVNAAASFVRPEIVGGWNALAQLPRPDDTAWSPGSTVIAEVVHPSGISGDLWAAFVAAGVGTRRSEGLGGLEASTQAWRCPTVSNDEAATTQSAAHVDWPLIELVSELPRPDREDASDWFAGRLSGFARRLRTPNPDRNRLADEALTERRLRQYSAPLVEAYYDTLVDESLGPDDLDRLARLMHLESLPEFMQDPS